MASRWLLKRKFRLTSHCPGAKPWTCCLAALAVKMPRPPHPTFERGMGSGQAPEYSHRDLIHALRLPKGSHDCESGVRAARKIAVVLQHWEATLFATKATEVLTSS